MSSPTMHFCTLFDSNYLPQGLALYRSLERHASDFHLYILAMDDSSQEILLKLGLRNATIISYRDFENEHLVMLKKERLKSEYYWTCTPSLILYCLESFNVPSCTYIDADVFFFRSPETLIAELSESESVLITEHRYAPGEDKSLLYGKYCVQFNTFKNNSDGLTALTWWRDRCIEWCSIRPEDGKFGDQKYLDDWLTRFKGVHELQNLGGGVAPWNIGRYTFDLNHGAIWGTTLTTHQKFPLVFYHFHRTLFFGLFGKLLIITPYQKVNTRPDVQKLIYNTYKEYLVDALVNIKKEHPAFKPRTESIFSYGSLAVRDATPKWLKVAIKKILSLFSHKKNLKSEVLGNIPSRKEV